MNKPCETCTKVPNPENCFDLCCGAWREWFAKAWDAACERIRDASEEGNNK